MRIRPEYQADADAILSHRGDLGGELWTTPDLRIQKGSPFSTLECVRYLAELGMDPGAPPLADAAALIWDAWRADGRFKVTPRGGILPCHTTDAAVALCRLGHANDPRMQRTFAHLLDTQYEKGGWRCNKFSYGRGPETAYANPHPTLQALDAFRFCPGAGRAEALAGAVELLLSHWRIRTPIGPCQYGMGTLFMQVEYPFRGYNLFYYVHVLSHYDHARRDERFLEAFDALTAKLADGQIVVERVVPKLARLHFCRKGAKSALATARYAEIMRNLEGAGGE